MTHPSEHKKISFSFSRPLKTFAFENFTTIVEEKQDFKKSRDGYICLARCFKYFRRNIFCAFNKFPDFFVQTFKIVVDS